MSRTKKIAFLCIAATFALHCIFLTIFYKEPLFLHPHLKTFISFMAKNQVSSEDKVELEEQQKERELEEFFQEMPNLSSLFQKPFDMKVEEKGDMLFPIVEKWGQKHTSLSMRREIGSDTPLGLTSSIPTFAPLSNPPFAFFELDKMTPPTLTEFEKINKPLIEQYAVEWKDEPFEDSTVPIKMPSNPSSIALSKELRVNAKEMLTKISPLKIDEREPFVALSQKNLLLEKKEPAFLDLYLPSSTDVIIRSQGKVASSYSIGSLVSYGMPDEPPPLDWDEDFEIEIELMPREEGGYVFSLTLVPTFAKGAKRIKQNFFFILDRSNSIERHRYATFKRAVQRALAYLQEGDSFNIFIFDKKITSLAETSLLVNKKSLQKAEEFIEAQEYKGLFTAGDIYSALDKIIPPNLSEEEVNTAFLLTDGNTLLKSHKQQKAITTWIRKNSGKVSLYTAAVGQGNNLLLLDLLSSSSGGQMLYSDTHASFPRKMAKMVLNLSDPIAKELNVSATAYSDKAGISFYSSALPLTTIYNNMPYTIVGTMQELSDFTLLIEARNKDRLLSIRKKISFQGAKKGGKALEQKWAVELANICYEDFLKDGKKDHLDDAKEILAPHRAFVAKK